MEAKIKGTVTAFALAGGLIPVVLMATKFIELWVDNNAVPYSVLYGFYLWPTSILLLGSHSEWDLRGLFWLVFSICANVVLYSVIGVAFAGVVATINRIRTP